MVLSVKNVEGDPQSIRKGTQNAACWPRDFVVTCMSVNARSVGDNANNGDKVWTDRPLHVSFPWEIAVQDHRMPGLGAKSQTQGVGCSSARQQHNGSSSCWGTTECSADASSFTLLPLSPLKLHEKKTWDLIQYGETFFTTLIVSVITE